MSEFAVRPIGLAPLLKQGEDLLGLLRKEPMHGRPARRPVDQLAHGPASEPAVGPDLAELEHSSGTAQRPPCLEGVVEEVEQASLGGRIDTAWDAATQPQPPFPSTSVNFTASSLHASESRATSARACSSS